MEGIPSEKAGSPDAKQKCYMTSRIGLGSLLHDAPLDLDDRHAPSYAIEAARSERLLVKGGICEPSREVDVAFKIWTGVAEELENRLGTKDLSSGVSVGSATYDEMSEAWGWELYNKKSFCSSSLYPLRQSLDRNTTVIQLAAEDHCIRTWWFVADPLHKRVWLDIGANVVLIWAVRMMIRRDPMKSTVITQLLVSRPTRKFRLDRLTIEAEAAAKALARAYGLVSNRAWQRCKDNLPLAGIVVSLCKISSTTFLNLFDAGKQHYIDRGEWAEIERVADARNVAMTTPFNTDTAKPNIYPKHSDDSVLSHKVDAGDVATKASAGRPIVDGRRSAIPTRAHRVVLKEESVNLQAGEGNSHRDKRGRDSGPGSSRRSDEGAGEQPVKEHLERSEWWNTNPSRLFAMGKSSLS